MAGQRAVMTHLVSALTWIAVHSSDDSDQLDTPDVKPSDLVTNPTMCHDSIYQP